MSSVCEKFVWLMKETSKSVYGKQRFINTMYRNVDPSDRLRAKLSDGTLIGQHPWKGLIGRKLQSYKQPSAYETKGTLDTRVNGIYFQALHVIPNTSPYGATPSGSNTFL